MNRRTFLVAAGWSFAGAPSLFAAEEPPRDFTVDRHVGKNNGDRFSFDALKERLAALKK